MKDFSSYYNSDDVIQLAQELVRLESHRDVPGRENQLAQFIYDYCRREGFDCEKIPVQSAANNPSYCERIGVDLADPPVADRFNVHVRLPGLGTGPTLLFNGHMDTVPAYDMDIEPFAATLDDEKIWGRGINDMKGALASMIMAMVAIKRSERTLQGDILFTAVVGEEDEGEGTEEFVRLGYTADGAIVGEPSGYEYSIGHRGLEWIDVTFQGKTIHSGQAHLGINAISKAGAFIKRVDEAIVPSLAERRNPYMGPSLMNYGTILGGDQPSTVAGSCKLSMDRRYLPGESVDSILQEYQSVIDELSSEDPDFKATLSLVPIGQMRYFYHMPLVPQPDSKIVQTVHAILGEFLGKEPSINTTRGWTDAAILSSYGSIPTVVLGPGDVRNSHTRDEHLDVSQLLNFVEIYANIALLFCQ